MDSGHGLPSSWAALTTHDCIQSQKDNYHKYNNTAQGCIRIWFGIRQIMNSTHRLLLETKDAATQLKTGIHMVASYLTHLCFFFTLLHYKKRYLSHTCLPWAFTYILFFAYLSARCRAEIPYENQLVADVHKVNHGTVTYLDKIAFLQNNLLAVHSVWVDDNEVNFCLLNSSFNKTQFMNEISVLSYL